MKNIDVEKICAYIWYTEARTPYKKPSGNNTAYLGNFNTTFFLPIAKSNKIGFNIGETRRGDVRWTVLGVAA